MYIKNEFVKRYYEKEEVIIGKIEKDYKIYNNLQKWIIYDNYGPKATENDNSLKALISMLMERFPCKDEHNIEVLLNQKDITILDILDGKAFYKVIKQETNNVMTRTWIKRFENAIEKYIGLICPIGNFLPCMVRPEKEIREAGICELVEWLEESNKQMEEQRKNFFVEFRKKMCKEIKAYYKRSLELFPRESIYLYHSWDDKGYIWVRQDQIEKFEEFIMPFEYCYYDGEEPFEKMIGEQSCFPGYREYAYIPYYDCRYEKIDGDFDLQVEKMLFQAMQEKRLKIRNREMV